VAPGPVPGSRLGPFELGKRLGQGNLGPVYLAHDRDAEVAVKLFFPDEATCSLPRATALRIFEAQARAAEGLVHRGVTGVLGVSLEPPIPYLVMQRIYNGRSLARYCEPGGLLPVDDAVRIVKRSADALHYAHEQGVLHRDVKPRNVLLGVGLEPKLTDFGLSVLVTGQGGRSPCYRAPEQLLGREAGAASDIFSLGVVLYQLLTGRHPFDAPTPEALNERIRRERHVRLRKLRSDVAQELQTITNRCLAKRPANRYRTAAHLAADLDVVLDVLAASRSGRLKAKLQRQLRALPLFEPFSDAAAVETLHHCMVHRFRAGDEIIAEGDEAPCFYVVVDGEVGIRRGDSFEIENVERGAFVGEVGALTGRPRSATVIALDRCTLLSVPVAFLQSGPAECQLALKDALLRVLAERAAEGQDHFC